MRLLIRIILCAITLAGSALLSFSNIELVSYRPGIMDAAKYELTASWSTQLMTSFAFIGGAPLLPLWGLLKAWRLRRNAQQSLWALLASALAAILLLVFRISQDPAEWFLADGAGNNNIYPYFPTLGPVTGTPRPITLKKYSNPAIPRFVPATAGRGFVPGIRRSGGAGCQVRPTSNDTGMAQHRLSISDSPSLLS